MLKTEVIQIRGMFCNHCEVTVQKALLAAGAQQADASFRQKRVEVTYDPKTVSRESLQNAIADAGYEVGSDQNLIQTISILVILISGYVIARRLGWTSIFYAFPSIGTTMELGMLFVVGLMTSVHCIAMCGGINLSQATVNASSGSRILRSNLQYNFGRVLSYTLVGALCGAIGQTIGFGGRLRGVMPIVVGIVMVLMACSMLGIFRGLPRITILDRLYARLLRVTGKSSSWVIGFLNGFMPCGPLQSMQIYALGTGSALMGGLSMLLFSLGTVPLMFGFGLFAGRLQQRFKKYMLTVSAVIIFLLGIHMASDGLALSGSTLTVARTSNTVNAVMMDGIQQVRTEIDYGEYPAIRVVQGIPVRWNIHVPEGKLNGCNGEILIPEYDLDIELQTGDNWIEFTPEQTGTIPYSCWMGMIHSSIEVEKNV